MKKIICLIIILYAVEAFNQELKTDCAAADPSLGLVNYTQLQLYSLNYSTLHSSNKSKHTRAYYINSRTFEFLDFFAASNPQYFGFNIYFISYRKKKTARSQAESSQSLLYVVPVYDSPAAGKDTTADYIALEQFFRTSGGAFSKDSLNHGIACDGECDSSINAWTYNSSAKRLDGQPGGSTESDIFLLTTGKEIHATNRENFKEDHLDIELGGKQTTWVYFKAEKIKLIADFVKGKKDYPMVGIYFGSYNAKRIPKQAHKDQTTLTLVPMRQMSHGYYEPDVCAFVTFINEKLKNGTLKFRTGINHSELCPDDCPTGGNK